MKPPRFATVFESVLTAIASQQVTRTLSVLLLNRLALNYGGVVHEGESAAYAFPRAEDLATISPADLRQLGFSLQKGRAMIELARSILVRGLDLKGLTVLPDAEAIECLCGLRGVGRWSAEYVLLRGLGRTHVFPGDDVGARKNLERWLNLVKPLDYAAVHRTLRRWHPYAGLVYFHLLLDRLEEAGFLATEGPQDPRTPATDKQLATSPIQDKTYTEDHADDTRVQGWRSCGVELGSGPRSRNDQEKGHLRHQV
jgi:DNA-3-methyladenine glycosylase II